MPIRKTTREPAISSGTVVVAADGVVARRVAERTVLMDALQGAYYGLDEIGARVWTDIEREISVREICDRLRADYEVEAERCEREVVRLLREMVDRGLVRIAGSQE